MRDSMTKCSTLGIEGGGARGGVVGIEEGCASRCAALLKQGAECEEREGHHAL